MFFKQQVVLGMKNFMQKHWKINEFFSYFIKLYKVKIGMEYITKSC